MIIGRRSLSQGGPGTLVGDSGDLKMEPHDGGTIAAELHKLEVALSVCADGVVVVDADGTVTFVNEAALALLRRLHGGLPGSPRFADFDFRDDDGKPWPQDASPLERALRGETVAAAPARVANTSLTYSLTASPVHGDDGRLLGAVCAFHETMTDKHTEVEWQRLVAALQDCRSRGAGEAEMALLSQMVYERERWRTMVESMLDPVTVCDAEGRVTYINPAYEHLIGRHVGEGVPLTEHPVYYQLYHPDGTLFDPTDLPLQRAALRGEDVRDVEVVHRTSDGHEFVAVFSASPLRDGDGRILGAVAVGRDVTALRNAERAVQASEIRYRDLFESLAEGLGVHEMIFAADGTPSDYRFLDVNAAFETITGLSRDAVLGRTVREVLPGIEQSWIVRYGEVVRTGEPMRFESYAEPLHKHFDVVAYRAAPGRFATLFVDVSDRKRAEAERERLLAQVQAQRARAEEKAVEALRASAQLNALLENLGEAVVIADAKGRVVLRNQVARDITGMSDDHSQAWLERREQAKVFYSDGRPMPAAEQGMLKVLRGEVVSGQEAIFERPDGTRRWLLLSGSTVKNDRGEVELAIAVYSDITAIRQMEKSREAFVTLAAHELKTPLTTIKGFVQLLNRQGGHDAREQDAFRVLRGQTERMVHIVQGLLTMVQVQSGGLQLRRQRLDLAELARQVLREVETQTRRHTFDLVAAGPLWVNADAQQVQLVLSNLVDNAIKYSPEGGPVEVAVRRVGTEAVVSVRDEGIGIPDESQPRLFEAFYQAAPMIRPTIGLGLGLHLSREVARLHGGRIWFESKPHAGSTFYFALPLAEG